MDGGLPGDTGTETAGRLMWVVRTGQLAKKVQPKSSRSLVNSVAGLTRAPEALERKSKNGAKPTTMKHAKDLVAHACQEHLIRMFVPIWNDGTNARLGMSKYGASADPRRSKHQWDAGRGTSAINTHKAAKHDPGRFSPTLAFDKIRFSIQRWGAGAAAELGVRVSK